MRTPRLPVVDWTDAPVDLNVDFRFAERRNLVSARVPSHFKRSLPSTASCWWREFSNWKISSAPYLWICALGLALNIPSLARQRCLPSRGPRRTPWFFCNFSIVWCGRLLKLCFLCFWNYNSVIKTLLASNILCLFISTEVTGGTELPHTHSSFIQHLNNVIFWALSAGNFSILQRSEPKNNKNNNIPHL